VTPGIRCPVLVNDDEHENQETLNIMNLVGWRAGALVVFAAVKFNQGSVERE
jgi:hypothetical protein